MQSCNAGIPEDLAEKLLQTFFSANALRAECFRSHSITQLTTCPIFTIIQCRTELTDIFKGNVQYQFGYGRTYTKFSLEDISLVGNEIKATI